MRKALQLFEPKYGPESTIRTIIVDRLNAYIAKEEDKAELITCQNAIGETCIMMIGTNVTEENWEAMKQEAYHLAK